MDAISLQRIQTAHPLIRKELTTILGECERALTGRAVVRFTQVLRTWAEQDGLYALGRTKVNPDGKSSSRPMGYKVTNAKGGHSIHNFGLAVDFCLIIDGKEASWNDVKDYDADGKADWMEVVAIFKKYGWSWGGDWSSFIDKPHFEKTFGYTLAQLRDLHAKKKFIEGTTYVAMQASHSGNVEQKETSTAVNLRLGPGTDYGIVQVLPRRTEVNILRRLGNWSEVFICSNNQKGWVASTYLK